MPDTPFADLHLHSTCSDGSDPPERVVERAAECGIGWMALTDHDTSAGNRIAADEAEQRGIGFFYGTEISSGLESDEVHILGLGFRADHPVLEAALQKIRDGRDKRAARIVDKLRAQGIDITEDEVRDESGGEVVTRIHVGAVLQRKGLASSVQDAFDKYLNPGRPAHVGKVLLPVDESIAAIQAAGGLAVLAHPGLNRHARRIVPKLLHFPFDGIEVKHISHTRELERRFEDAARSEGLLMSGGSDCHGRIKGHRAEMGKVQIPMEWVERMREKLADRQAAPA